MTTWWLYVESVARGAQQSEIAEAAGVSQATISRWKSGDIERPSADAAVRLAVFYGASVGGSLVAAGVLAADALPVTIQRYEAPTDDELIELLERRLRRDREDVTGNAQHPAPTMSAGDDPATVTRRAGHTSAVARGSAAQSPPPATSPQRKRHDG